MEDSSFGSRTSFGSVDFDGDLTLSDRLKIFKASKFNPSGYVTSKCQAMNEKLVLIFEPLVGLRKASAEEMRRSVYANYSAFIRTSKEISDLESELLSMRNLLSAQTALIHGLVDGNAADSMSQGAEGSAFDDISNLEDSEPSEIEIWKVDFLEILEVLLAEKRVDETLAALEEGQRVAEEAKRRQNITCNTYSSLRNAISEQRTKLADQLAEAATQPSMRGAELYSTILALKRLGDGPRAHSLLLNSHSEKIKSDMRSLHPSAILYGGAYTAHISQLVFSTIAQAASDSLAIFGEEPAYASALVTWAVKQVETFSLNLKRQTLASSAAAGGLRSTSECVQICLGYCSLLEARGLALSPILLRFFRPCVEMAVAANLKKIEQCSAALAASDDWSLAFFPVGMRPAGYSSATSLPTLASSQPKLSSSAHRFNSMVQEFFEEVGLLESLKLGFPTLDGVLDMFSAYVSLLMNALPGSEDNEEGAGAYVSKIVRIAETESQQIALLANASLLADELLPRAAMKLLPFNNQGNRPENTPRRASERQNRHPEQREWKKRLQREVDKLRDSFCRQHALELIFDEDGEVRLGADMYILMDGYAEEPEWFPSPIFQELFSKLTRIASIATDMFIGRERFATILLMRLTETVILWLSNDQSFWEEIEQGPTPLGPLGLRQFYLDMEFVILFASQGRYLSRNLHQVIQDIIERAIDAVAAAGIDTNSALPEIDWFADVAQIAIKMLIGKANFGNDDRESTSPTASMSAASLKSLGSN